MKPVRLGVIGLGWFGDVLARGVRASGKAMVVACYARSEEARAAFAEAHGCRAVDDLDVMLEDRDLEGVLIATPHSTHTELAVRAATAGKHVFVEKPLALTVTEVRRIADAARGSGVVLQVGHNRRRQPANRRIARMIRDGELGTVLQLEGVHTAPGGHRPGLPAWRKDPAEAPFGGMTGLGVHTVDTFHAFVGRARRVAAFSTRFAEQLPIDDATVVAIEYEAGPLATISTNYFTAPVVSLAVFGSEGAAWNEEDGARFFTQRRTEPARTEHSIPELDTVADEVGEFVAAIRGEATPETGVAAALEVAAVLEAVGSSVASGAAVDLAAIR
jgi:predicted dehydrogenase